MPLVDGDLWFESRLLMESCRFYDLKRVAQLVCDNLRLHRLIIPRGSLEHQLVPLTHATLSFFQKATVAFPVQ